MSIFTFTKSSDLQLIEGIAGGGSQRRQCENKLYEKYFYFVKEGVRKHRISEDDAASAYSDTILTAIDSIVQCRFEGRSELKTYLFQIFSNKCVDVIRKNTTNKESIMQQSFSIDEMLTPIPDESRGIIQKLIAQSEIEKLYQQLQKIGEKCKQMILAWGEGYNDEEISLTLGYNTAAVAKTSRLRCLEKLRENYGN